MASQADYPISLFPHICAIVQYLWLSQPVKINGIVFPSTQHNATCLSFMVLLITFGKVGMFMPCSLSCFVLKFPLLKNDNIEGKYLKKHI